MIPKVTVVDYNMSNLLNVVRAFEHCGAKVYIAQSGQEIAKASRLVLPGVGAFKNGMKELNSCNLVEPIKVFGKSGKPFLGICLGMQMMLDNSEEFGNHPGLGLIPGNVVKISSTGKKGFAHKIPHIGWNKLLASEAYPNWRETIFSQLPKAASMYFVHSYVAIPKNKSNRLADCDYNGHLLCAALKSENLYGCQFHPEKSGQYGLKIINEFINS